MAPLVSCVIPYRSVENYFTACLESVASQTMGDFEVIMVDDGSQDDSVRIARTFEAADPRFRIVSTPHVGVGEARNVGIDLAEGRYLTFVDSDDLLAPRAFEQYVTSLEESGSDLAAANVWRLSLRNGVFVSPLHSPAFSGVRRVGTSIRDVPLLYADRMIWNKMWRRDFWQRAGLRFPSYLFEDYPVALGSHLAATAVDLLPDPTYVWRERAKGDSVSQLGHQVSNATDRVTAAREVLRLIEDEPSDLRELVESHFVEVDLREIVDASASDRVEDRAAMDDLARQLAGLLDPGMVGLAPPPLQAVFRAVRTGDVDRARALRRPTPPPRGSALGRVRRVGRGLVRVGRGLTQPRRRTARLQEFVASDREIRVRIAIPMRAELAGRASVAASIGGVAATASAWPAAPGLQANLRFDTALLARLPGTHTLTWTATAGPVAWTGGVAVDVTDLHGVRRAGRWIQAVVQDGALAYQSHRHAVALTHVELSGASRVTIALETDRSECTVERPWPGRPWVVPLTDGHGVLDLAAIVDNDPADNPVTGVASRRIAVDGLPVRLGTPTVAVEVGERRVEIRAAADGTAFVVHRPRPTRETS